MTRRMNDEERMEARDKARHRADEKAMVRLDKQMDAAERMIGQLNSGKFYVYPVGGKYREGSRSELVSFLIRNRYV